MKRTLCLIAIAVLLAPALARADGFEQATLREIDRARAEQGLGQLQAHAGLSAAAARAAQWMADNDVLGHPPDLLERLDDVAPHQHVFGETLAWMPGSRETLARRTVRAWLRSPPHRAILLMGPMQLAGVATCRAGAATYVAAEFAG